MAPRHVSERISSWTASTPSTWWSCWSGPSASNPSRGSASGAPHPGGPPPLRHRQGPGQGGHRGVSGAAVALPDSLRESRPARRLVHALLTSLLAYPLIVLWTLVGILFLFPVFFPLLWLSGGRSAPRAMRRLVWIYGRGWLALMSPFVRFSREGVERLDGRRGRPWSSSTTSPSSTPSSWPCCPSSTSPSPSAPGPSRCPGTAAFMRLAGYLDVEALTGRRSLAAARRIFDGGGLFLFFPEGHRSRDGRLHRFHSGAFKIAIETGVPVDPAVHHRDRRPAPPGPTAAAAAQVRLPGSSAGRPGRLHRRRGHRDLRQAGQGCASPMHLAGLSPGAAPPGLALPAARGEIAAHDRPPAARAPRRTPPAPRSTARASPRRGSTRGRSRTARDLARLPFTTKGDLEARNDDFLAVARRARSVDVCQTSGTTGLPVAMLQTRADLERLAYNEEISFRAAGIDPGERVLVGAASTAASWPGWPTSSG